MSKSERMLRQTVLGRILIFLYSVLTCSCLRKFQFSWVICIPLLLFVTFFYSNYTVIIVKKSLIENVAVATGGYGRNRSRVVEHVASTTTTHATRRNGEKLIAFYAGKRPYRPRVPSTLVCDGNVKCKTERTKNLTNADAVVFNAFYLQRWERPPSRPNAHQVWVFFCHEPENNIRYAKWPSAFWKTSFNWTMTFRRDSDIPYYYGTFEKRDAPPEKNWLEIAKSKNRTAAWFASHCRTEGRREDFVKLLEKLGVQTDSYGKCGGEVLTKEMEPDCYRQHKFYFSFESVLCGDYFSEKVFKLFDHDIVPVVRGGDDDNKFPPGSVIYTKEFKTTRDLAGYLLALDRNDTAYAEVLRRKSEYGPGKQDPWCDLCRKLHALPSSAKTYPDIDKWLDMKKCYPPTDL